MIRITFRFGIVLTWACLGPACTAISQTGDAGSWSRFRGPNGTGIATSKGLPVEFGPEKNVLWRTRLPAGHSSPVLSGDAVFVTGFDDTHTYTVCLDWRTGAERWKRGVKREHKVKIDKRNNVASATPAVSADRVVAFFEELGLIAYDHTGEEKWRILLGPFDNIYGMGASPVIVDGRVFQVCDQSTGSFVLAVAADDGEELWRMPRKSATSGHCTPVVYRPEKRGPQLIVPGSFLLDAYDMASGERVWWVRGLSFEMKSTPVLHDGVVYINGYGSPFNQPGRQIEIPSYVDARKEYGAVDPDGISKKDLPRRLRLFFEMADLAGDNTLGADDWAYFQNVLASKNGMLAIRAGGEGDMTEQNVLWSYRRTVPQLPSPLLYGDVLYMLQDQSGFVTTMSPAGKLRERGRLKDAIDSYYASPVAADGKVYFTSLGGLVTVTKSGGSLDALAVNDLGEDCYATPAIAHDRIFLRTVSALYCFGISR